MAAVTSGILQLVSYPSLCSLGVSSDPVRSSCAAVATLFHREGLQKRNKLARKRFAANKLSQEKNLRQDTISSPVIESCLSAMAPGGNAPTLDFQHIPKAAQKMMADLIDTLEAGLGKEFQTSTTPADVQSFENAEGNANGSVVVRRGRDRNFVDRTLVSALHCKLPFGELNFATVVVLMGPATDAPHLVLEFPFSGAARMTTFCDALPRRDLARHVAYLQRIYGDTSFHALHKQCESDSRMHIYVPPTLYNRCTTSPTALLYTLDAATWPTDNGATGGSPSDNSSEDAPAQALEKMIRETVHPLARRMLDTWLDVVKHRAEPVAEGEARTRLAERDAALLEHGIQAELTSNLPRLFGQAIADRVVDAIRNP
eukprot:jgi/Mesen1/8488/ME000480S07839